MIEYVFHILIITGFYMILTMSLNLIVGYTGLPDLGHAAFYCIGAYVSALLALNWGISPWIGLLFGACCAAFFGGIVGSPLLRLKGDYLALATFGFGVIVYSSVLNWMPLTRGPLGLIGIPGFSLFGIDFSNNGTYLILVAVFVVVTYIILSRIDHSPFGRILRGIREDEIAVQSLGKNVGKYKLITFIIGALFAGIAGSLYAHYILYISPSSFTVMESIIILLMVVFGGLGSFKGSLLGASILVIFPEFLRFVGLPGSISGPFQQMIFGLMLIVLILKRPQGILGNYRFG